MSFTTPKRRIETVDLTATDDEAAPTSSERRVKKQARVRTGLPTPPSSSQHRITGSSTPASARSVGERESWAVNSTQSELNREIFDLDDFDEGVDENYQLYGVIDTKVVGVRFYIG